MEGYNTFITKKYIWVVKKTLKNSFFFAQSVAKKVKQVSRETSYNFSCDDVAIGTN